MNKKIAVIILLAIIGAIIIWGRWQREKNSLIDPATPFRLGAVTGIYSLPRVGDSIDSSVTTPAFATGVSVRAFWKSIEREDGNNDWAYFDKSLLEIKKAGKKAMIRVLPGIWSPAWLYGKGVPSMEFQNTGQYRELGKTIKMPVLWEDAYINEWTEFVSQFGKRYDSREEITLVHMAGPTYFSAEMYLPKLSKEGRDALMKAGYTKDKIVNAWKKVIDAYDSAFPSKLLALNIARPFSADDAPKDDGALEEIIEYAGKKLGSRLHVQENQLSADHTDSVYYQTIKTLSGEGTNVGFQMLWSATEKPNLQGSLGKSINDGLAAGAHYFEIYQTDMENPKYNVLFNELSGKLKVE